MFKHNQLAFIYLIFIFCMKLILIAIKSFCHEQFKRNVITSGIYSLFSFQHKDAKHSNFSHITA